MLKFSVFKGTDVVNLNLALNIRFEVFVDEMKISKSLEQDEYDLTSTHYLLFSDKIPVATARWRDTPKGIKIERCAVKAAFRNMNFGKKIINKIINDIKSDNKTIYLHSQAYVVEFYKKLGFIVKSDPFFEADIKHYEMIYNKKA